MMKENLPRPGKYEWQGYIVSSPEPGWYLVQLLAWISGAPTMRRLVRIEDMRNWFFYEDAKTMALSYKDKWA